MVKKKRKSSTPKVNSRSNTWLNWKWVLLGICLLITLLAWLVLGASSKNDKIYTFKVHRNWTLDSLDNHVQTDLGISTLGGFSTWAKLMGYSKVKPCILLIDPQTSAFSLIRQLRKNRKQTIDLVIKSGIYDKSFADLVASKLDITEADMLALLHDNVLLNQWGVNEQTWPTIIIPNTYNVSVGLDAEGLMKRLSQESELFWNEKRMAQLNKHGSSKNSVITVASIVCKESSRVTEYKRIAGVYMNRLHKGMKLQADPTVNFARGVDARVRDTKIESPYNTYLVYGLPPGPICIPSIEAIDAVLDYEVHDYLYFCAKSDFSGTHLFESDYNKHKINARKFNQALNKEEKIRDSRK